MKDCVMADKPKTSFCKKFMMSRAWVFCMLYLLFSGIELALAIYRMGLTEANHITNIIVLASIALAFGLEHLYHWATRKS